MENGIVIPCYNEANRLKFNEFRNFISQNSNYLLCFVNDGSKDATLDQLLEFQAENSNQVRVVNLVENQGKAEAVRAGMLHLLSETEVDRVGFMDADLATDFIDYKRLVQVMIDEEKQMVVGSRKMNLGNDVVRSAFRKIASAAVGMVINLIIAMPVRDTQCGAKVFERSTATYLFKQAFISRWLFDVELFIRIRNLYESQVMSRISEVGLLNWTEVEGSKISLTESLKFPVRLMEIAYSYRLRSQLSSIKGSLLMSLVPSGNRAAYIRK